MKKRGKNKGFNQWRTQTASPRGSTRYSPPWNVLEQRMWKCAGAPKHRSCMIKT